MARLLHQSLERERRLEVVADGATPLQQGANDGSRRRWVEDRHTHDRAVGLGTLPGRALGQPDTHGDTRRRFQRARQRTRVLSRHAHRPAPVEEGSPGLDVLRGRGWRSQPRPRLILSRLLKARKELSETIEQSAELEARQQLFQPVTLQFVRQDLGCGDVDGHIRVQKGELLGQKRSLPVLHEQLPTLRARDLACMRQHLLQTAELGQQLSGRLLSDAGHAGDVVRRVALQPYQIGYEPGRHPEALLHGGGVVDLHLRDPAGVRHYVHVFAGQLQSVAIAGDDEGLAPFRLGLAGKGAQDVVGFVAGQRQVDEAECLRQLDEEGPLLGQRVGHGLALSFVFLELRVPEGLLLGVPSGYHRARLVLADYLHDHRAEPVERVGGKARRGTDLRWQRVEGPEGYVVAVEQKERPQAPLGRTDIVHGPSPL